MATLQQTTVPDSELSQLSELVPGEDLSAGAYVGYVVPGNGPASSPRNAIAVVYDPRDIYRYGILPTMQAYRGKRCFYCGKELPFPIEPSIPWKEQD